MRFTEHELTLALTGAAKSVVAARDRDVRRGRRDVDEVWEQMDRLQRFRILDSLGTEVLPVLVGLPDVDVAPGTRPEFSADQVREAVEERIGEVKGRLRRKVAVEGRVALVRTALQHVPPRTDPDALGPLEG